MPAHSFELHSFEYSIIRVVPRVEREEFLNVGVLVSCPARDFLQACIEMDAERLRTFAPALDITLIEEHLRVIPLVCKGGQAAGPIGKLSPRARFHWLVAPRSTMIQCSPVHSGFCEEPLSALEHLLDCMVRVPATDC